MNAPDAVPGDAAGGITDLDVLRARLDAIDARLLDQVRDRIMCCLDIADYKSRHGVAMMQPHRIEVVQQRAARFAADNGLDGNFLRRLYDLIITETCRVETLAMGDPALRA